MLATVRETNMERRLGILVSRDRSKDLEAHRRPNLEIDKALLELLTYADLHPVGSFGHDEIHDRCPERLIGCGFSSIMH